MKPAATPVAVPVLRRSHPTSVLFLDESGAIVKDRIFGIGVLRMPEPARIHRAVQKLRDRVHQYGEFKFSLVNDGNLDIYRDLVGIALGSVETEFWCFVADRTVADPIDRFGSPWAAYGKLAEQLITGTIHADGEIVSILADNYSSPDTVLFEEDLKESVNRRLRRLAVASACRLDSRASSGIQLVDILTSAVTYEFRVAQAPNPKTAKAALAMHTRALLGTSTCAGGWRNDRHSVAFYDHGSWQPRPPRRRRRVART